MHGDKGKFVKVSKVGKAWVWLCVDDLGLYDRQKGGTFRRWGQYLERSEAEAAIITHDLKAIRERFE